MTPCRALEGPDTPQEDHAPAALDAPLEHHALVQLAAAAIAAYVCEQRVLRPEDAPTPIEGEPAGVFVTIHSRSTGDLRGCIGTIGPCEPELALETIHNAIAAATRDPRFPAVGPDELDDLEIDVSVLDAPELIESAAQLDPRQYGVIVERGRHRGLLLPDIPGIDDAATQIAIAREKAWIKPHDPVKLYRFKVDKYT
jgi:AmmeMemoRadiSam system protein A